MRAVILLSLFGLMAAATMAETPQRIYGGSDATIDQYPMMAALLFSLDMSNFQQACCGTIINNRSILTAAHCVDPFEPFQYRLRLGSTYPNSGGDIYTVNQFLVHPYESLSDADIAIMRSPNFFTFTDVVKPGSIAGPNYVVADNAEVWAAGWGSTYDGPAEQLQHVQFYVISEDICRYRYGNIITSRQICCGVLDIGGRDQCTGDSGGPVFHNGVVIGVTAYGHRNGCGDPYYPGVNMKVASFSTWIQANA